MAAQTTRLSIDIDPKDHRKLKMLADANGVSPYLHPNKKFNKQTQKAIQNAEKGINLRSFKSLEHMWENLGLN